MAQNGELVKHSALPEMVPALQGAPLSLAGPSDLSGTPPQMEGPGSFLLTSTICMDSLESTARVFSSMVL